MEILSPAGSPECIAPAIRMGADAVYLGASQFSARSSAANFNKDELKSAIATCHISGVKVYVAINTLIHDDEMQNALEIAKLAVECGADALIIQDLGFASLVKKACPSIRLHASTQMSVHTPGAAKMLYEHGFSRVVLARELSKNEIKEIASCCEIETEIFVHGALCMSVSGQCYLSAMIGSRSGNRGGCAQPCRLPFAVCAGTGHDLSLKDLSIINYIKELEEIGVTSAKIEGRMKRPEYVAAAVNACRQSADNGRADDESLKLLQAVFSRSGFTDGYYTGKRCAQMFGTRTKENVTAADNAVFKKLRAMYNKEAQRVHIDISLILKEGSVSELTLSDGKNSVVVNGSICSSADENIISEQRCTEQLKKTGGTPYLADNITINVIGRPLVSVSEINSMRRDALNKLSELRSEVPERTFTIPDVKIDCINAESHLQKRYVYTDCNIPAKLKSHLVFVPLNEKEEKIINLIENGYNIGIRLPSGMFGSENIIINKLKSLKQYNVNHILTGNLGGIAIGKNLGMTIHGDFNLNIANSYSLDFLKILGVTDAVVSVELTYEQIRKLKKSIPAGVFSRGYVPLMLTRNCPNRNSGALCSECNKSAYLKDRTDRTFPIVCDNGCSEILNSVIMEADIAKIADSGASFTIERVDTCSFLQSSKRTQGHTGGLYTRGVL